MLGARCAISLCSSRRVHSRSPPERFEKGGSEVGGKAHGRAAQQPHDRARGRGSRSVSKLEEELLTLHSENSRTIARRPAARGLPRDEHAGANGHRAHSGYHDELHF